MMKWLKKTVRRWNMLFLYDFAAKVFYTLALPFSHRIIKSDHEKAEEILQQFSPKPQGSALAEHKIQKPYRADLQVIVPAYNVENYLDDCMRSILSQKTQYSFHVILVDDGSTDATGRIADTYAADARVTVIHQKNQGPSGTRNAGLATIEAPYVSFVDSDDMLPNGAIQALMENALKYDADIVEGAFTYLVDTALFPQPGAAKTAVRRDAGGLRGQPWGKVYRSALFRRIGFPQSYFYEDSINAFLLYPMVKKAVLIPESVYIYRLQSNSICHTASHKPKCVDTYWVTELMVKEHRALQLPEDEAYHAKILRQILQNARRVKRMPEEVQQSVFILSGDLLNAYFDREKFGAEKKALRKALERRDFGAYRLYCKTH